MKEIFATERISAVRPGAADADFLFSLYGDEAVMAHLGGAQSRAVIEKRLLKWAAHWDRFGFGPCLCVLRGTGERTGVCAMFHSKVEGESVLEIGWLTAPAFQRRGFALEAARGYLAYAQAQLPAQAIAAFPGEANLPSNLILQKLGFTRMKEMKFQYGECELDSVYWRLDAGGVRG